MGFAKSECWVWDFWCADDGERFHLFYLHAPKSLPHPDLRHRNARIGHATSIDLVRWEDHGLAFPAGDADAFDRSATWTGCIVRGSDGLWRMYYTGSVFLSAESSANVETVGLAVSTDLFTWKKRPGPICSADSRWYETLGSSSWPEEAWRDPWVFRDDDGLWHMLVTARANSGDEFDRGVIGHAISDDMEKWRVMPPLSRPGSGFAHLEVMQLVDIAGATHLLFCCDTPKLAGRLTGQMGGTWSLRAPSCLGPFHPEEARLLDPQPGYAGRAIRDRSGRPVFMAFDSSVSDDQFAGVIGDPLPLGLDASGNLELVTRVPK